MEVSEEMGGTALLTHCEWLMCMTQSTSIRTIRISHSKNNSFGINVMQVLDEHEATWRTNGLSDLKYSVQGTRMLSANCTVFTVDVHLNDHWSDDLCGVDFVELHK